MFHHVMFDVITNEILVKDEDASYVTYTKPDYMIMRKSIQHPYGYGNVGG